MKRIRNVEVCIEGTVTRHGTVIGPAMTSLVGYPELTPSKGSWCGNDIWREVLPPAQTHAAREMVRKLGDVLSREGYRGYFEVDLLHDLDSDELYLGEVNPRLSGASPMTNLTTEAYADMPLFLFHLLEYMDVDYELDIEEINSRWERGYGEDEVWGQVIIQRDLAGRRAFHRDAAHRRVAPRRRRARLVCAPRQRLGHADRRVRGLLHACRGARRLTLRGRPTRCAHHARASADRRLPAHRALPALGQGHQGEVRLDAPDAGHADRLAARRTSVTTPGRHLTGQLAVGAVFAVVISARRRLRADRGDLARDRAGRGVARSQRSGGRHPCDQHRRGGHHRRRGDGHHRHRRVGRRLPRVAGGRGVLRRNGCPDPAPAVLGEQVAGGSRRRRAARRPVRSTSTRRSRHSFPPWRTAATPVRRSATCWT